MASFPSLDPTKKKLFLIVEKRKKGFERYIVYRGELVHTAISIKVVRKDYATRSQDDLVNLLLKLPNTAHGSCLQ